MIRRLTVDQVIKIHDGLVPGSPIRDLGTLQGAVAAPFQGFGNVDFFPGVVPKAAKYLEGLCTKQAFTDGNKRTAWIATHSFLRVNGLTLAYIQDVEVEAQVLQVIARTVTLDEVALWLNDRIFL